MPGRIPVVDIGDAPDGFVPICPHCDQPLTGVVRQQLAEQLGKAYVWACSGCRKVLGVSHRKGFWMG